MRRSREGPTATVKYRVSSMRKSCERLSADEYIRRIDRLALVTGAVTALLAANLLF